MLAPVFLLLLLPLAAAAAAAAPAPAARLPPVVLLNGLAGAVIQAKLTGAPPGPHFFCERDTKNFTKLWVSPTELVPGVIDCFFDNLRVRYDGDARAYSNKPGVTIDGSVDWGGVGGLEYLDPGLSASGYFHDIVKRLAGIGYAVGTSLRGAPYDWRLAPDGFNATVSGARFQNGSYYSRLRALVEETYALNGNAPVVLLTHSMGGPTALAFLQGMSPQWKATYVAGFVPMSPPFGGAMSTVKALVSGDTLGVPIVAHDLFHPIQSSCASGPWLFPQPALWPADAQVLLTSNGGKTTWTSANYTELCEALGLDQAAAMFRNGLNDLPGAGGAFAAPGVRVEVLRGTGVATPAFFAYDEAFQAGKVPAKPSRTEWEYDGDGTVNGRSLHRAEAWVQQQDAPVNVTTFQNVSHFGILMDGNALDKLQALLEGWHTAH